MDETRKLHSTNAKAPALPTQTQFPRTSTSTESPASTTEPLSTLTPLPVFTPTILPPAATTETSCIPANRPVPARVLEIVDGNTVKVLMNDLVYVVRYIGVEVPQDSVYAMKAYLNNSKLVFRKDVILIADGMDKDVNGRLLRYVLVEDTFVKQQLIQDGWGKAVEIPPNSSYAETFQSAEEFAIQSAQGMWATVPTSTP